MNHDRVSKEARLVQIELEHEYQNELIAGLGDMLLRLAEAIACAKRLKGHASSMPAVLRTLRKEFAMCEKMHIVACRKRMRIEIRIERQKSKLPPSRV